MASVTCQKKKKEKKKKEYVMTDLTRLLRIQRLPQNFGNKTWLLLLL